MKEKSSCSFGKELETYIAQKFQELGYKFACRSNGSGNKGSVGDISGIDCLAVECKNKSTKDITIKEDVWQKLVNELPLHSSRMPMYALRNKNKKTWCVMDSEDFFVILKGYLENLNGRV